MQRSLFDRHHPPQRQRVSNSQRADARQRHPGMVLLFRQGNRYELIDEDALLAAKLLGLELTGSTSRPVVSFPIQFLEAHLRKLLHFGHRVAICDSEEDQA
jgi:DNA mismatch repair protein MutS